MFLDLFFIECANVLWKYIRWGGLSLGTALENLSDLAPLGLAITTTADLMTASLEMASQHSIRASSTRGKVCSSKSWLYSRLSKSAWLTARRENGAESEKLPAGKSWIRSISSGLRKKYAGCSQAVHLEEK